MSSPQGKYLKIKVKIIVVVSVYYLRNPLMLSRFSNTYHDFNFDPGPLISGSLLNIKIV